MSIRRRRHRVCDYVLRPRGFLQVIFASDREQIVSAILIRHERQFFRVHFPVMIVIIIRLRGCVRFLVARVQLAKLVANMMIYYTQMFVLYM